MHLQCSFRGIDVVSNGRAHHLAPGIITFPPECQATFKLCWTRLEPFLMNSVSASVDQSPLELISAGQEERCRTPRRVFAPNHYLSITAPFRTEPTAECCGGLGVHPERRLTSAQDPMVSDAVGNAERVLHSYERAHTKPWEGRNREERFCACSSLASSTIS